MASEATAATQGLRLLIANERPERLEAAAAVVREAGHAVVGTTVDVGELSALTRDLDPDVAVVAVGADAEHALGQVETIAEESACPVIVLLPRADPEFVAEAAARGVFGYALDTGPDELQSSIEIALRRFMELRELERAFRRRAVIERAKGVLMERHGASEREAFELLRGQARRSQRSLLGVAESLLVALPLLPGPEPTDGGQRPARDARQG